MEKGVDVDFDINLGGETTKTHLLALIVELNGVTVREADRKLQVGLEKVRQWSQELKNEGLIEVSDEEYGDESMRITKVGLRKFRELEDSWVAREEVENPKKPKPKFDAKKAREKLSGVCRAASNGLRESWMDLILIASAMMSIKLMKDFFDDPNVEALSFLLASVLLSLIFLLFSQYRRFLKTAKFVTFIQWMLQLAKTRRNYIVLAVTALFMIYFVGMILLNPLDMALYLLLLVVFASGAVYLMYYPQKTIKDTIKFYVGVVMITSGLMMVLNILSLTELFFQSKFFLIDLVFGIGLTAIVYLNREYLGFGPDAFGGKGRSTPDVK